MCLFDIRMPHLDGLESTRELAGARGFLLKNAGPELLAQAIHAAAKGDALIAPNITVRLLAAFVDSRPGSPPTKPVEPLTNRAEEILIPVARGRTNSEIADELHISISTVKTHLASFMRKLAARNRVEFAMWPTKPAGSTLTADLLPQRPSGWTRPTQAGTGPAPSMQAQQRARLDEAGVKLEPMATSGYQRTGERDPPESCPVISSCCRRHGCAGHAARSARPLTAAPSTAEGGHEAIWPQRTDASERGCRSREPP